MADQSNRAYEQGASVAGRAGRTAGRATGRAAKEASKLIPFKVKLVIFGVIFVLFVFHVLVGGLSSSSFDSTFFLTAENAEEINAPENDEEMSSVYNKRESIKTTVNLASIIQSARQKDRNNLEENFRRYYSDKKDVVFECDSDTAPVYISEEMIRVGGGQSGLTAAEAAIAWAKERYEESKHGKWYYVYFGSGGIGKNGVPKNTRCPLCHPDAGSQGWQCIGFVTAAYYHGAGVPSNVKDSTNPCSFGGFGSLACNGHGTCDGRTPDDVYRKWKKRNGNNWEMITCGNLRSGSIDKSLLQPGDVLIGYNGSGEAMHMSMYLGEENGHEVIDCSSGNTKYNGRKGGIDIKKYGRTLYPVRVAMRYTGSSTEVSVAGTSAAAAAAASTITAKPSYTELGEIKQGTGERFLLATPLSKPVAQSFAYVNGTYAVAFTDGPVTGTYGKVKCFDENGRSAGSEADAALYHANGSCMSSDGTFYVAGTLLNGRREIATEFSVSGSGASYKGTKTLPRGASAIAYDKDTGNYILSTGDNAVVYDRDFNKITDVSRSMHGQSCQDIGAGGGYIYACHTKLPKDCGTNYVDIYSESTGEYCGTYLISYGELESADVVNGELVLLVHIKHTNLNYIHKTGIALSGSGFTSVAAGYVTESDMDILAAYSVSLSNSELRFDKNGSIEKNGDEIISGRYVDITGRPVKLHWFGKDAGKINYERDLASKVDEWTFYDDEVEISDSGDTVHITLKELPVHKICEKMFGVDPYAEYVNAGTIRTSSAEESSAAVSGKTTNGEAIYILSANTARMLFSGLMERGTQPDAGGSLLTTGSWVFPLPSGTWTQTDYFNSYDPVRNGRSHTGVDLGAKEGTPIYAATPGIVTVAGWNGGYGNCVIIKQGNMEVVYGHMARILISPNTMVNAGTKIGLVGNTGNSFGSHLHFEVRINGTPVDPAQFIPVKSGSL